MAGIAPPGAIKIREVAIPSLGDGNEIDLASTLTSTLASTLASSLVIGRTFQLGK